MKKDQQSDEEVFWAELKDLLASSKSTRRASLSYLSRRLAENGQGTNYDYQLTQAQLNSCRIAVHKLRDSLAHQERLSSTYFKVGFLMTVLGYFKPEVPQAVFPRPPFNAEFLLHLLLRREERAAVIGDLAEDYGQMVCRFGKQRADVWFYKQVAFSLFPLVRRAVLKIGALVWLGRVLRQLIS